MTDDVKENYELKSITIPAKLIAKQTDYAGYTTYVFENLGKDYEEHYIMCVRYPNWQHSVIDIGKEGFLTFSEIIAGIDKWFDGQKFIPFNYSGVVFIKFIEKKDEEQKKFII